MTIAVRRDGLREDFLVGFLPSSRPMTSARCAATTWPSPRSRPMTSARCAATRRSLARRCGRPCRSRPMTSARCAATRPCRRRGKRRSAVETDDECAVRRDAIVTSADLDGRAVESDDECAVRRDTPDVFKKSGRVTSRPMTNARYAATNPLGPSKDPEIPRSRDRER